MNWSLLFIIDGVNETFESELQHETTYSVNDEERNTNHSKAGYPSNIIQYPSQPIEPTELV